MIDTILNHRTIRKYKTKAIEPKILDEILLAGSRASTTGNMQVYSIIVSKDPSVKEQLWEAHFRQNMVKEAPIVLTFCADFNRFNKWCRQRNSQPGYDNFLSFFTAAIDALLVAQNVCVAAESYKLGICYLGTTTYMASKIIEILKLPEGVIPVTTVVLGYPDENPELTDRLPVEAVIHSETYSDYSTEEINNLFSEKEHLELYKEIVRENQVENLAQVFTEKRYTKKDNVFFSNAFLDVIKNQGFMNNE
ncbi:NADPH-dependent oxidoreductase [Bacteroidota bacterium]